METVVMAVGGRSPVADNTRTDCGTALDIGARLDTRDGRNGWPTGGVTSRTDGLDGMLLYVSKNDKFKYASYQTNGQSNLSKAALNLPPLSMGKSGPLSNSEGKNQLELTCQAELNR